MIHYCIVRGDLNIGAAMAQLAHAAGESSPGNLESGTVAVVLAARDESHLLEIERELVSKQVPHKSIREPDAPFFNQLMSIGVIPGNKADLKPHFKKLPLYK